MAASKGRRRFGNVRKLPSGRYQARYVGPDGFERKAPRTFDTERQAAKWLTVRGVGDHQGASGRHRRAGEIKLGEYGRQLDRRAASCSRAPARTTRTCSGSTSARTSARWRSGAIKPQTIRTWRSSLLDGGTHGAAGGQGVLAAAGDPQHGGEGRRADSARTRAASRATTATTRRSGRPRPSPRCSRSRTRCRRGSRALVIVAAFSGLRWGELAALRRCDVDLDGRHGPGARASWPRCANADGVRSAEVGGGYPDGHPSGGGVGRCCADHLADVRGGRAGRAGLHRGQGRRCCVPATSAGRSDWAAALRKAGLPAGFHFHDLRHTGNTLAAASGASTRELMHRMGHASMRAALIYQHATSERDREIADGMDRRIKQQARSQVEPRDAGKRGTDQERDRPVGGPADGPSGTDPPGERPATGTQWHARSKTAEYENGPGSAIMPSDLGRKVWSGRRESNPHSQFGRLKLYH